MSTRVFLSPCPNDIALSHGFLRKLWPHPFSFEFFDIETLNRKVLCGEMVLGKVSAAVFERIARDYEILEVGRVFAKKGSHGPRLIGVYPEFIPGSRVYIPGENTSAAMAFRRLFPAETNIVSLPFRDILDRVLAEKSSYGIIIHEAQWSLGEIDLCLDLGEMWYSRGLGELPLGGLVARRDLLGHHREAFVSGVRRSLAEVQSGMPIADAILDLAMHYATIQDRRAVEAHMRVYAQ